MRREGRVGGKPTNKTRATGKCKKVGCHGCHSHPLNKADVKCKGREKRFAGDVSTNPRLAGVCVMSKPRKALGPTWDGTADEADLPTWDEEEVIIDADALIATPREGAGTLTSLTSMIERALLLQVNSPEMDEGGSSSCSTNDDVDDDQANLIIQAFKCEFETFKNGIEAAASCQTSQSRRIRVAPSDSSWSDIELSEMEGDWEDEEDDWSVVEFNAIVQFGHAYT